MPLPEGAEEWTIDLISELFHKHFLLQTVYPTPLSTLLTRYIRENPTGNMRHQVGVELQSRAHMGEENAVKTLIQCRMHGRPKKYISVADELNSHDIPCKSTPDGKWNEMAAQEMITPCQ